MKKLLLLIFSLYAFNALADNVEFAQVLRYNDKIYGYVTFVALSKSVNGNDGAIYLYDTNFVKIKEAFFEIKAATYIELFAFNGSAILIGLKEPTGNDCSLLSFDMQLNKQGELEIKKYHGIIGFHLAGVKNGFLISYLTKLKGFTPVDPLKEMYSNKLVKTWSVSPQEMPSNYNGEEFISAEDNYAFFTAVDRREKEFSFALEMINLSTGKLEGLVKGPVAKHASYDESGKLINVFILQTTKEHHTDLHFKRYDQKGKMVDENVIPWAQVDNRPAGQKDPYEDKKYHLDFREASKLDNGNRLYTITSWTEGATRMSHNIFAIETTSENKFVKATPLNKKSGKWVSSQNYIGEGFNSISHRDKYVMSPEDDYNFTLPASENAFYVVYGDRTLKSGHRMQSNIHMVSIKKDGVGEESYAIKDKLDNCQVFPATGNRVLLLKFFKGRLNIEPEFIDIRN